MKGATGMTVFAFSRHPDDIEFMMAGTLLLLKEAGCSLHYMNLAERELRLDGATARRRRRGSAVARP